MDKRTVVGLIVCFVVLFLYFNVFLPLIQGPSEPQPERPPATIPTRESPRITSQPLPAPTTPPASVATAVEPLPEQEVRDGILYETDLFRVELTNRGAAIQSIILRDFYKDTRTPRTPKGGDLPLITELERGKLSLSMLGAGDDNAALENAVWQYTPVPPEAVPEGFSKAAQFRTRIPARGLEVVKTFLFREPTYPKEGARPIGGRDIQVEISITNLTSSPVPFQSRWRPAAGIVPDPDVPRSEDWQYRKSADIEAVVGGRTGNRVEVETYSADKVEGKPFRRPDAGGDAIYAGVKNRYFVAVLKPLTNGQGITAVHMQRVAKHNIAVDIELPTDDIPAGGSVRRRFMFFVAPRMPEMLRDYSEHHFESLLAYPWPAPITRVLSWLLQAFRHVTPNYGWAIVLLTVCVRVLLHPLTLKSQKSAHKMQKIQPLVNAAKEKYKHDKRQQQQEVMRIMREQGANPLGGCLPMLLQLPIFIGLWRMLYQDASLRHAPFLLWIDDLSQADNLLTLDFALPLMGRSLNLLPILCAVAMAWHQKKMTPPSTDPQTRQQQKIMMFMPILFAVMLYHMPSGLMVYFLSSTAFGVLEQHLIRKRLEAAAAGEGEGGAAAVPVERPKLKPTPRRRKRRGRR